MRSLLPSIHKTFFFILVLFLPLNLSKHFIFDWSFSANILIDYLIPTFYVTDFLVLGILAFWDLDLFINRPSYKFSTKVLSVFTFLLLFLLTLSFSVTSFPSLYKIIKLYEMAFLFLYVGLNFSFKKDFDKFILLLSSSVLFESVLGFIQYLKRGSLFNNYLFFGEQPYNYKTIGVNVDTLSGVRFLPPYGTFPHPNVLAGFLAISLLFILYYSLSKKITILNACAFFYGFIVLVLTGSLNALATFFLGVLLLFSYKYISVKVLKICFFVILLFNLAFAFLPGLKTLESHVFVFVPSIYRRLDLINASVSMIKAHPLTGVGLNLFTVNLESYGGVRSLVKFLQPVHNIFYLLASESGLPVLVLFILFLYKLFVKVLQKGTTLFPLVAILQLMFLGTFDHYLFTIQQGMLLTWLTLGLALSTIVINEKKLA